MLSTRLIEHKDSSEDQPTYRSTTTVKEMNTLEEVRDQIIPYAYKDGYRTIGRQARLIDRESFFLEEGLSLDDGNIHVLFVPVDTSGCGFYRALQPTRFLQDVPGLSVYASNIVSQKLYEWAHIVVWERVIRLESLDTLAALREAERIIIFDIDDELTKVPEHNPAYKNAANTQYQKLLKDVFSYADHVLTPNAILGRHYEALFGKPFSVIQNVVNVDDFVTTEERKGDGKVRVGWAGSPSHLRDIQRILPTLRRLADDPRVQLVIFGWNGTDAKHDLFKDMDIEHHPFVKTHEYAAKLASLHLDIGLAPLEDSAFNCMKSPLKWEEYAACGVPTVASKIGPYHVIDHGVTGLLASGDGDFARKVFRLVEDEAIRKEIGTNAKKMVETYFSFEVARDAYIDLFQRLIASRL